MRLLFYLLFLFSAIYSQQQHNIKWPSLSDSPWSISRGDAQATGRSNFIGPRNVGVSWIKDMPLGIVNGPVIGYNNILYFGTRALNSIDSNFFYSLDKNGNEIWVFSTEGKRANIAGPTLTSDSLIVFSSLGVDVTTGGGLYALNYDGSLKWKNSRFVLGSGTRFIPISKESNLCVPWEDSVYIIDINNGIVINSFYTPNIYDNDIVFSVSGDTIYYISGRMFTSDPRALNAVLISGEFLWSLEFSHLNHGTPVVDNNNRLYIYGISAQNESALYCINPDGTINWKYPFDNLNYETFSNYSSPTIDSNGNIVFETSSQDSGYISSVDYYGNLNWKTTLGHYNLNGAFINHGLVCDMEGKIYFGSSLGDTTNFWCLNNFGNILWKLGLEGYQYDASPAINSEGTLYIGTHLSSLFVNHERNLIAISDSIVGIANEDNIYNFSLFQNYPNPFNPITHIDFMLNKREFVLLKVYNIIGECVKKLVSEEKMAGYYSVIFDGSQLAGGAYFYELTNGFHRIIKKMVLIQ
jgi:hypothetical protein